MIQYLEYHLVFGYIFRISMVLERFPAQISFKFSMPSSSGYEVLPENQNQNPKENRFKEQKYKDVWALVLWLIFLVGFAVLSCFAIKSLNFDPSSSEPDDDQAGFTIDAQNIVGILLSSIITSFALSFAYFLCMQR